MIRAYDELTVSYSGQDPTRLFEIVEVGPLTLHGQNGKALVSKARNTRVDLRE